MNSKRMRDERAGKKPYVKPEVKEVQLKPEEAVLGGCKMAPQVGPGVTCEGPPKCSSTEIS